MRCRIDGFFRGIIVWIYLSVNNKILLELVLLTYIIIADTGDYLMILLSR